MKIIAYAICKNEAKFVERWYNSMKEADEIYILDTGSEDNTIELFSKYPKVTIKQEIIKPWRFDIARNHSLDMVPSDADVCVCTDLDELFEPGWRKKIEEVWEKNTTDGKYLICCNVDDNKQSGICFYISKIHSRNFHHWSYAIHEALINETERNEVLIDITLYHYPDNTKSRGQYLGMLESAVEENPTESRYLYYLAREYMYYNQYEKSIKYFHKYLNLPTTTWNQERSSAMRMMSKMYEEKGDIKKAIFWCNTAIKETPDIREVYYDLGRIYFNNKEYEKSLNYFNKTLKIKNRNPYFFNDGYVWNDSIYDYLSCCEFFCGNIKRAFYYVEKAYKTFPNDERIKQNYLLIKQTLNNKL